MTSMSFLQSSEWEQFQNLLGRKTWRAGGVLIIRHDLPGGFNYLYCPRPEKLSLIGDGWLKEVGDIAARERSIFLRVDPAEPFRPKGVNFRISRPLQPQKTTILGLGRPEDELLSSLREKTRYNIRLAERKGVSVSQDNNPAAFWEILRKTAEREGFHAHSRGHYEKLFSVQSPNFSNELFFAEYGGGAVAAALINFYENTATYLHGASLREYRAVMAPHLLHWRIIQEAKKRGLKFYDFWGVDEKKWPGVTKFKLGFGGEVIEYPPSVDMVYRPWWYGAYTLARRFK